MNIKLTDLIKENKESEKHNKKFHQDKPVAFKKPTDSSSPDELPKAEKEQKEKLDANEEQAEIANPSSTDFFKELRDNFQKCVNEINGIVTEEPSAAALQAHDMELDAKPYGNWADPASGKVVAKTVKGHLVKVPDDVPAQTQEPEGEGETSAAPEIPENPVDKLVNAANGNYMKVKKVLAKRVQTGDEQAKTLLKQVIDHEQAEKDSMMLGASAIKAQNDAKLKASKEKYAQRFPSPQI
jgi:hypothetical protein